MRRCRGKHCSICAAAATREVARASQWEPLCNEHFEWLLENTSRPPAFRPIAAPCRCRGKRRQQTRREYRRAYHERNREKVLATQRAWREKNREYAREYAREYQKRNREKVNAQQRAYRQRRLMAEPGFRERAAAKARDYYERNREKAIARQLARRSRLRGEQEGQA